MAKVTRWGTIRASKEVSWPSVTAALQRNTVTSTTTPRRNSRSNARNGRWRPSRGLIAVLTEPSAQLVPAGCADGHP